MADPIWPDPLDPSFAGRHGGRWNPPRSHPTLYLNGNVETARLQLHRMLLGSPVTVDDLDDGAFVLVTATLPRSQRCADAVTSKGLKALGLPATYPRVGENDEGAREGEKKEESRVAEVDHDTCQTVGVRVRALRLRGLWCRSAATPDGRGRELAWFPATVRSVARPVWPEPLPLGGWRYARDWSDLGLHGQRDPIPEASEPAT